MSASPTSLRAWRLRLVGAAALGALALASCSRPAAPGRPPEPGDKAVAMVGGQPVWASDVRREAVAQGLIAEGEPLDVGSARFHQVLDEVIDQKLLAAEALKRRLDRDPMVRRRIAAARERILGDALLGREADAAVSESAIKGLYDEQVRLAGQTDEVHIRQIVAANPADAAAAKAQIAGGAPFDAVAMQRSVDAGTRFNGGDLGYVAEDALPPAYEVALKGARAGDLVGPFQADAGWVVIRLEDRRAETAPSMAEARPQIVSFLHLSGVKAVLEGLRKRTPPKLLIGPATPGEGPSEPASAPARALAPAPPAAGSPASPASPARAANAAPAAPSKAAAPPPSPKLVAASPAPAAKPRPRPHRTYQASAETAQSAPAAPTSPPVIAPRLTPSARPAPPAAPASPPVLAIPPAPPAPAKTPSPETTP
jgi:peptidyl-prolyl cis-trans isomerase C